MYIFLLFVQILWHYSNWFNDRPGIDSVYTQAMDSQDNILGTISMICKHGMYLYKHYKQIYS